MFLPSIHIHWQTIITRLSNTRDAHVVLYEMGMSCSTRYTSRHISKDLLEKE